jgi:hypothetical protein
MIGHTPNNSLIQNAAKWQNVREWQYHELVTIDFLTLRTHDG